MGCGGSRLLTFCFFAIAMAGGQHEYKVNGRPGAEVNKLVLHGINQRLIISIYEDAR